MKKRMMGLAAAAIFSVSALAGCTTTEDRNAAVQPETPETTESSDEATTAASEETVASEAATEAAETAEYTLLADGVLSVGCEVGYPPFEKFAEDGTTPVGFDIDIISEVADRLGLELNIINTSFDGIFAGIGTNYDIVCSACTITPERQETMLFSAPYINNYQAVVLPADSDETIASFNDLDGKVVALQKGTTSDELIGDYESTGTISVKIVASEKVTSCFTQLTNGEVDAVVADSTVADGFVASYPDKYRIAYLDEAEPESFGIAIGKDNEGLQTAINEVLAEMEADGTVDEIYEYWFGSAE
ncbi:MAG: transporter substrate-binding domain-containing protein [Lachnospiraceae bacterium]|nr:transporter substrate-binding domain-containing protein [Lachnospiraceae bacterium]